MLATLESPCLLIFVVSTQKKLLLTHLVYLYVPATPASSFLAGGGGGVTAIGQSRGRHERRTVTICSFSIRVPGLQSPLTYLSIAFVDCIKKGKIDTKKNPKKLPNSSYKTLKLLILQIFISNSIKHNLHQL